MLKGQSLSYNQNGRQIFQNLNFEIAFGTLLNVLGPNGSGKSTFLRNMAGFMPFSTGKVLINNKDLTNKYDFLAQNIEYIGHLNSLKRQMTALENLSFWLRLNGVSHSQYKDFFDIKRFANCLVERCSEGQARRLSLSRLSYSQKRIWLLDEPDTALDDNSKNIFRELIRNHCLSGGIVIMATHENFKISDIKTSLIDLETQYHRQQRDRVSDPFLSGDW